MHMLINRQFLLTFTASKLCSMSQGLFCGGLCNVSGTMTYTRRKYSIISKDISNKKVH